MVSLIIVDYKSIAKTMNYIEDCYQNFTDAEDMHVLIVDNAPEEQIGLDYLRTEKKAQIQRVSRKDIEAAIYECTIEGKKILYIAARENLGYARGNNLGAYISKLIYQDTYYLFSNNDLQFKKTFALNKLMEPMKQDHQIGVVGPKIVSLEGELQSPRIAPSVKQHLFMYYWNLLLPKGHKIDKYASDVAAHATSGRCSWVTGSFFFVDAAKFWEVQGFDTHTFLFYEEIILGARLLEKNYHMYYTDSVEVIHAHGETVRSTMNVMKSIDISYQSSRYYFKQYKHLSQALLVVVSIHYGIFKILFQLKKAIGSRGDHIA